jgi:hypothetical protein
LFDIRPSPVWPRVRPNDQRSAWTVLGGGGGSKNVPRRRIWLTIAGSPIQLRPVSRGGHPYLTNLPPQKSLVRLQLKSPLGLRSLPPLRSRGAPRLRSRGEPNGPRNRALKRPALDPQKDSPGHFRRTCWKTRLPSRRRSKRRTRVIRYQRSPSHQRSVFDRPMIGAF